MDRRPCHFIAAGRVFAGPCNVLVVEAQEMAELNTILFIKMQFDVNIIRSDEGKYVCILGTGYFLHGRLGKDTRINQHDADFSGDSSANGCLISSPLVSISLT